MSTRPVSGFHLPQFSLQLLSKTSRGVYSPLVLGFDLTNRTLYDELYPIIANKRVISINQQWAGNSGVLVANSSQYFRCVRSMNNL